MKGEDEGEKTLESQERVLELRMSYRGSAFHGWQIQPNLRTVQGTLLELLRKALGEPELKLTGSSRTDAGVHAHDQHASFSTQNRIPVEGLKRLLQQLLPPEIRVWSVVERPTGFSSRYEAKAKHYSYFILNRRHASPFVEPYLWSHGRSLDAEAMNRACLGLVGTRCYRALQSRKDFREKTQTTIYRARIRRMGDLVIFDVLGRHFLYLMVRNMVGALLEVGWGEWQAETLAERLETGDRRKMGVTMPPQGLHLFEAYYAPPPYEWSEEADRFAAFLAQGATLY